MHRHVVTTARFLIVLAIWIHFIKHYAHNSFQEITTVASCTKRMMDEGLSYMRCSFSGSVKKDTKLLTRTAVVRCCRPRRAQFSPANGPGAPRVNMTASRTRIPATSTPMSGCRRDAGRPMSRTDEVGRYGLVATPKTRGHG